MYVQTMSVLPGGFRLGLAALVRRFGVLFARDAAMFVLAELRLLGGRLLD